MNIWWLYRTRSILKSLRLFMEAVVDLGAIIADAYPETKVIKSEISFEAAYKL